MVCGLLICALCVSNMAFIASVPNRKSHKLTHSRVTVNITNQTRNYILQMPLVELWFLSLHFRNQLDEPDVAIISIELPPFFMLN